MLSIFYYIKASYLNKEDKRLLFWIKNKIGVFPRKLHIYKKALTHSSIDKNANNQSLEFVGDSILGVVVSEYLYRKYNDRKEGFLSQMKMKITNGQILAKISLSENLCQHLRKKRNVSLTENILEDTIEAFVGAIYIDRGYNIAKKFITDIIINKHFDLASLEEDIFRYKTWCLEWASIRKKKIEIKTVQEDSNDNSIYFVAEVYLEGFDTVKGESISKKKSEEEAFKKLYILIKSNT